MDSMTAFNDSKNHFISCMNDVFKLSSKRDRIASERKSIPIDSSKDILRFYRDAAYDSRVRTVESIIQANFSITNLRVSLQDLISDCNNHNSGNEICEKCRALSDEVEAFEFEIKQAMISSHNAKDEAASRTLLEPKIEEQTLEQILFEMMFNRIIDNTSIEI